MSIDWQYDETVDRIDDVVPRLESGLGAERETIGLAVALLAGLSVFAPAFATAVEWLGLPVPLPLLVAVALVGLGYGVLVVLSRRIVAGTVVALVVAATFKANVPVLRVAHEFPKDFVGDLLLVHVPLVLAACLVVALGWFRDAGVPALLLTGFVAATTVPWIVGWAPSTLAAASFSLFAALALVVYLATLGAVADGYVEFRTVVALAVLTVGTHAAVGVVQFLHQDPLGFTRLGEGGARRRAAVVLPAVGEATIGPYVSGFTGMSFVLGYLVVLVFPATVLFVARRRGEYRLLGVGWILLLVGIVRASASDAARGALVVAVVTFLGLLSVGYWRRILESVRYRSIGHRTRLRGILTLGAVVASALAILGYPSDVSGKSVGEGVPGGSSGATASEGREISIPDVDLEQVSIPLVNLSNLGVRLQQYVAAVDVFLRHPAFGIGGGNWVVIAGGYGFQTPWNMPFPNPIHSVYFTLLAETGAVGLGLYLASIAAVLLVGIHLIVDGFDGWWYVDAVGTDRVTVAAIVAGLVGTLAFSVFDVIHLYAAAGLVPFWALAGALVGEYRRIEGTGCRRWFG